MHFWRRAAARRDRPPSRRRQTAGARQSAHLVPWRPIDGPSARSAPHAASAAHHPGDLPRAFAQLVHAAAAKYSNGVATSSGKTHPPGIL